MKFYFYFNFTAFFIANKSSNTDIVKLLLETKKFDVNEIFILN